MDEIKDNLKIRKIKLKILKLLKNEDESCNDKEIRSIEEWISSQKYISDLEEYERTLENEKKLDNIVAELKLALPLNAVLPSEKIQNPDVGENADCSPDTTYHIDEFLYSDQDIEKLFPDKTKYCDDCGSHNIMDTVLLSHSLSRLKLEYLFNVMLPKDCVDKTIMDVGSRIGAVLYAGSIYTNAKCIYGVEMNEDLYNVQKKIVSRHNMEKRVKLINDDIINQGDLLSTMDIVILNNVFEFFLETEEQIKVWLFIKKKLKKDCILITLPSVELTFMNLGISHELKGWLDKIPVFQNNNMLYDEEDEVEFHDMYMYTVK